MCSHYLFVFAWELKLLLRYRGSWREARRKASGCGRAEKNDKTMVRYRFLMCCGGDGWYKIFTDCLTLLGEWDWCVADEVLSARQIAEAARGSRLQTSQLVSTGKLWYGESAPVWRLRTMRKYFHWLSQYFACVWTFCGAWKGLCHPRIWKGMWRGARFWNWFEGRSEFSVRLQWRIGSKKRMVSLCCYWSVFCVCATFCVDLLWSVQ